MRYGHRTTVLVVNTTGGPIKLKQGVLLTQALTFDRKVVSEPLDLPDTCITSVHSSRNDDEAIHDQVLESLVIVKGLP